MQTDRLDGMESRFESIEIELSDPSLIANQENGEHCRKSMRAWKRRSPHTGSIKRRGRPRKKPGRSWVTIRKRSSMNWQKRS